MDVPRPTEGIDLCTDDFSFHIIMPLTISQCDPVLIYYNNPDTGNISVSLSNPDSGYVFLSLYFPPGVRYLEWICDIPTSNTFIAIGYGYDQLYTVQSGSSSACLHDITTTYTYAFYNTTLFQSFTQSTHTASPTSSFTS